MTDTGQVVIHHRFVVEKHHDGDTSKPADEVITCWFDDDGNEITDPAQVAALEAEASAQGDDDRWPS